MKERTIDILTAVFLIAFSLVMRSQLEGIPREGVLFPLCVLYLIMASSVLLALRAIMAGKGEMSFFGDIPPQRWCLVTAVSSHKCLARCMFHSTSAWPSAYLLCSSC